jgi:4a-hydroxytetrahydrobiopterin dehydratase
MTQKTMTSPLAEKKCSPCEKKSPPLGRDRINELRAQLDDDWKVVHDHHLEKNYTFENFREALDFTNRVGEVAETENHHPDISLGYGKVGLKIWTHNIGGLSENDFILAAKADEAR